MPISVELGQNIVQSRNTQGFSQERLANDAGLSQSHLRSIEHGKGNPTLKTLIRLADALQGKLYIHIEIEEKEKDEKTSSS